MAKCCVKVAAYTLNFQNIDPIFQNLLLLLCITPFIHRFQRFNTSKCIAIV